MAGRIINCPMSDGNIRDIYWSRVNSTRVLNAAVLGCQRPPRVWLNSSTATIYAHAPLEGRPNDEATGVVGGFERDAPLYWLYSVEVAKAWESAFFETETPGTRKVALRSSFVVETEKGGPFDTFYSAAVLGFGGRMGSGKQWTSWIHEKDFVGAVDFLIARADVSGVVNVCAPNPVLQEEFMVTLRKKAGICYAVPMPGPLVTLFTYANRSDPEIPMKSRRVVPGRLLQEGYEFAHPHWETAAEESVRTWRAKGYERSWCGNTFKLFGEVISRWCGNTGG
eukprot:CAMPEP_0171273476 /NCGR_PEP_ID=MMETSP0790-20130122/62306_1 /TAXON_ID=2925 /ORGANISM="Alexandrium catenella, Strain OF101" /LENGTH=280 /DNA_ID=CAMNT_0011742469 /DNA_START=17 /DNA_END=856 /DNA_ORIENTATION=-